MLYIFWFSPLTACEYDKTLIFFLSKSLINLLTTRRSHEAQLVVAVWFIDEAKQSCDVGSRDWIRLAAYDVQCVYTASA